MLFFFWIDMAVFDFDRHYASFRMGCIDPGFNNLGVTVWDVNSRTGKINWIEVETMVVDKRPSRSGLDVEYVGERRYKLRKIHENWLELCREYRIDVVCHETPFYNPRMPNAFASLVEVLAEIKNSTLRYCPTMQIIGLSPQSVKKGVGASGQKGKDIMFDKVTAIPEIMKALGDYPIDELTEHCIDSMAVGWTTLTTILKPQENWL